MNPGRLIRTVLHLQPAQVGWRIVHEARLRIDRARPERRTWFQGEASFALPIPPRPGGPADERLREEARLWRSGAVRYLALDGNRDDFAAALKPKLWRYERQYHRELVALAYVAEADDDRKAVEEAKDLVAAWAAHNPQPRGDAWEPYPVARRILNWTLAAWVSPSLRTFLAPGIAAQARFLAGRLERHLLGNHFICDAAALAAAGAAVDAPGLAAVGARAMRLLAHELAKQTLPDGGYAERTAQYHAIVLRDVLVVLALSRARGLRLDPDLADTARAMARWLSGVARGDGAPYLNDAAPDAMPKVSEVLSLARALRLVEGPWDAWLGRAFGPLPEPSPQAPRGDLQLRDTGWTFVRAGTHELLFDHGPIGPDEQPGHGHSDALSYELVWDGHPVVVDTGVTTYDRGAVRDFERSAPAHATVSVDGQGPDELWAAFRVGARGVVTATPLERVYELRRCKGAVTAPKGWKHVRVLAYKPGVALLVDDRVEAAHGGVRSRIPLAPGCSIEGKLLRYPGGVLRFEVLRGTLAAPVEAWVGEGFGRRVPRSIHAIEADGAGGVVYALLAESCSISIEDGSYVVKAPEGAFELGRA